MTRILVVEGDPSLKKALHDSLETSGVCEIDSAEDEQSARYKINKYTYDLIILDLNDAEANVPDNVRDQHIRAITAGIKEQKRSAKTKILALTNQSAHEEGKQDLREQLGFDRCLRRPVPQTKLIQELNSLLT
jgi:CheY-like chemotaxis protein